ncbi:MAG: TonB-dependent receptor plug domain-containing protein, partial [Pseudomonadota bacterium]
MHSFRKLWWVLLTTLPLVLSGASAQAAEGEIEEVVVTGSFIKRTSQVDSVSPITNVGLEDIDNTGIITGQELFRWLPSNTGSENQADALTQGGTPGTANVNLRGLGLGSTLVLINGRRQTVSSATANGGDTFTDINSLMPLIMLENIEVLKDGAAAIFGSDAVAGVVNYKTRDNFEGFEVRYNYQATGDSDDQEDQEIAMIWGASNDTSSLVFAASYFDRSELTLGERNLPTKTQSTFGQPGSYLPLAPSPLVPDAVPGAFNADPGCAGATGATVLPTGGGTSLCLFDFGPAYSLVPDEQRLSAYVVGEHYFSEALTLRGELGVARNESVGGYSSSFPNLAFPLIDASHPGNPYGVPVLGRFRVIGDGFGAPGSGRVINEGDHQTTRFVLNANGDFGVRNWGYDASWTWSQNDYTATAVDQVLSRINLGVAGFGGPRCSPLTGTAGVGDCEYLNPFASGFTPGSGVENSPEILDWVTSDNQSETKSELSTFDLIFSGDVVDLPGGTLGVAFGYQRREESRVANLSDDANNGDLAFLIGDLDTNAEREIDAFFVEALVPIFDNDAGTLEAQLAVRNEDYSTGFDSTDPKVGLLYRTQNGRLALRGTFGTAFRAPTLFQQFVQDTSLNQTSDPLTSPNPTFLGWTASPADLDP